MNVYVVLEKLIKHLEKQCPATELIAEAKNMIEKDLSTQASVDKAQALITDIQTELHNKAPAGQYFGMKNDTIGYWPYSN